jgi:hypothetical protein
MVANTLKQIRDMDDVLRHQGRTRWSRLANALGYLWLVVRRG